MGVPRRRPGSLIRTLAYRYRERSHRRRAELFLELMRPAAGSTILDLGGGDGEFLGRIRDRLAADVTVADLHEGPRRAAERYGFRAVRLEEGEALPFRDGEFDIVVCHSVIEHVTVAKELCRTRRFSRREWRERAAAGQRRFADEIRRVGRRFFVQTPHRHFPVEPHTWLPLVNWLGHESTRRVVAVTDRFWVKRCDVADWRLLTTPELRRLFPGAEIHVERFAGWPKSIIAYTPAVVRARAETEWESFLPPRAGGWRWRAGQRVKRAVDVALAAVALPLLAPVFLVIAVVVKATSRGPVFYRWHVLGRHGRPFVGYKFRTMVEDADDRKPELLGRNEMRGPAFKMRDDPRVTPVGRWLRRYSLDELPQLWSVLKGDMSLVGPRPPGPDEFARFEPWQRGKLAVTPGITCLWQVNGRSHINDFGEWARLDCDYIERWSLLLDLRILLRTLPAVLRGDGAY